MITIPLIFLSYIELVEELKEKQEVLKEEVRRARHNAC